MRINFSVIILIILFATIIFLLPVTINFMSASTVSMDDLRLIERTADVYTYDVSPDGYGIDTLIDDGFSIHFEELNFGTYNDEYHYMNLPCTSLSNYPKNFYDIEGAKSFGGSPTNYIDCHGGYVRIDDRLNYSASDQLIGIWRFIIDSTDDYFIVTANTPTIDGDTYLFNEDLIHNPVEEEETATTTYPVYNFADYNTQFLDYEWSATSTDITIDYQIDVSELSTIDRNYYIDSLYFNAYKLSATSSTEYESKIYPIEPFLNWYATSTVEHSQLLELPDLEDGDYTGSITFYDRQQMESTFTGITSIILDFNISDGEVTDVQLDWKLTANDIQETKYKKCNLTNLDNCILNALNFAFIPSSNYFTSWLTVWSSLSTSFPFQYLTEILDIFNTKTDTTTDETAHNLTVPVNFGNGTTTMTILNTDTHIENNEYLPTGMFAFIRNLLGLSVWLAMIFYIIGRIKSLNLKLV